MTTLVNNLPSGGVVGGRLRRFRGLVTLASQGAGTVALTTPSGGLTIPPGHTFAYGVLTSSVSLGSTTLAIGIAGSTGKYRAAAVFTSADTPTMFGVTAAVAAASETTGTVGSSPKGAGTDETIVLTTAAAALPASGSLVVDLYFSAT
jgi:hypothetical protein